MRRQEYYKPPETNLPDSTYSTDYQTRDDDLDSDDLYINLLPSHDNSE